MSDGPILVGYLPTPEGEAALDAAIQLARSRGVRLVVVHAAEDAHHLSPEQLDADRAQQSMIDRLLANEHLEHEVVWRNTRFSPAQQVLSTASSLGASLIVIGIRRRSAIGKVLLGSNAQEVILSSRIPVLCVHAGESDLSGLLDPHDDEEG